MSEFNELPVSNDPSLEPLDNAPLKNTKDILDIIPDQIPQRKYDEVVNLSEADGTVQRGNQIFNTTNEIDASSVVNIESNPKTATFVIGPSSNSESDTFDYVTDGTNDDVEIQAAIDALPTAGGSICFREGTYTLGSAAVTIAKNGVTLFGMGAGTIITCKTNFNLPFFKLGHASIQYYNFFVSDIGFDGNQANQNTATGVQYIFDNVTLAKVIINTQITQCYFINTYDSAFTSTSVAVNTKISKCYFTTWKDAKPAINTDFNTYFVIENCYFTATGTTSKCVTGGGATITDSVFLLPTSYNTTAIYALITKGNTITVGSSVGSSCIIISGGTVLSNRMSLVSGGSLPDVASIGISDPEICIGNNIATSTIGIGIKVAAGGNIIIEGNYVAGTYAHGIDLEVDRVRVSGNFVSGGNSTYSSIFINSARNIISDNQVSYTNRAGSNTNYGIRENSTSTGPNIIIGNQVAPSGFTTAGISIQHASTDLSHNITV